MSGATLTNWMWKCKGKYPNGQPCQRSGGGFETKADAQSALAAHWRSVDKNGHPKGKVKGEARPVKR